MSNRHGHQLGTFDLSFVRMISRCVISLSIALILAGCGQKPAADAPAAGAAPAAAGAPSAPASANDALLGELTQAVRKYAMEQRKVPANLNELASKGYLKRTPQAPPGKKFLVNKNLEVSLVDQ